MGKEKEGKLRIEIRKEKGEIEEEMECRWWYGGGMEHQNLLLKKNMKRKGNVPSKLN